jgi:hypothetical protein
MRYVSDAGMANSSMQDAASMSPTGMNRSMLANTPLNPAAINNPVTKPTGAKYTVAPVPFSPRSQRTINGVFGVPQPGTFQNAMPGALPTDNLM